MKMKFLLLIGFVLILVPFYGQSSATSSIQDSTIKKIESLIWLTKMYDHGISSKNDTLFLSPEFKRALNDTAYRSLIYPKLYTWDHALKLLKENDFKKLFWHLINLYNQNKQNKVLVLSIVLPFDKIMDMRKVMIGSFYTYCYLDPEIGNIVNGKPDIQRPNILESKLRSVRELVTYIEAIKNKQEARDEEQVKF